MARYDQAPCWKLDVCRSVRRTAASEGCFHHTHIPGRCSQGNALPCHLWAGNLYQHVYILPLTGAWLELPIVGTEFAGPIISLMVFPHLLADAPTALLMDALVVPTILASKAESSEMMQWMHQRFLALPEGKCLGSNLLAGQIYGPHNQVTDAGSRGRRAELEQIMAHLCHTAQWPEIPQRAYDLLDEAVAVWRELEAAKVASASPPKPDSAARRVHVPQRHSSRAGQRGDAPVPGLMLSRAGSPPLLLHAPLPTLSCASTAHSVRSLTRMVLLATQTRRPRRPWLLLHSLMWFVLLQSLW